MSAGLRGTFINGEEIKALSIALDRRDKPALFRLIEKAAHRIIGFKMMTIMAYHHNTSELVRIYSNNSESYPIGGVKFKEPSPWKLQLLDACTPVLNNDSDAIRENFEDCEKLFELGIRSILNIPIEIRGICIGTLNFGHQANWFSDAHIGAGMELAKYLDSSVIS